MDRLEESIAELRAAKAEVTETTETVCSCRIAYREAEERSNKAQERLRAAIEAVAEEA